MARRVTIKTIAEDLGISHMTVSRALSNSTNVRRETRELIRKRAAEMGYVKSAAASAMRGDATRIVGLLVPNLVNEFYARFANTLALLCEDNDLHLITHLTNDDPNRERLALMKLQELQTNAVVTVPAPATQPHGKQLFQGMKPIQFIRTQPLPFASDSIVIHDAEAIRQAVGHLVSRGHQRISYFGGHASLSSGRQRKAAFLEAMEAHNLTVHEGLIQTDSPSFEMGARKAAAVLAGQIDSSAIICGGFEISNGALDACLRANAVFPRDVAFVGYGDPGFYRWIQGGITTISLPIDQLAEQALQRLLQLDPDAPVQQHGFAAEFILRASA
ncbi:LacI family DNA-binding transcriptional regulator [Nitratireductor kimnyeongensis]|uniref:LacI family DNA-binding transcriptional regulator n=1 Tax=Nitratireductor kimnyeongensis TaxID=430679 RepID=A0ABW0T8E4_9HYPH|nr:LacI family DNA-binding transcriptional regulator [Nitratireductor kimnyeongensis]QZZ36452.1 LacI family transcriptional regulator [Nitratireductor kimnyeongensis]